MALVITDTCGRYIGPGGVILTGEHRRNDAEQFRSMREARDAKLGFGDGWSIVVYEPWPSRDDLDLQKLNDPEWFPGTAGTHFAGRRL
jgi:hypothetical protein